MFLPTYSLAYSSILERLLVRDFETMDYTCGASMDEMEIAQRSGGCPIPGGVHSMVLWFLAPTASPSVRKRGHTGGQTQQPRFGTGDSPPPPDWEATKAAQAIAE